MPWEEFKSYLIGIDPDTPLGRIVAIRSEKDPNVLANFTPEQRRIQSEWHRRMAAKVTEEERDRFLMELLDGFKGMAGAGTNAKA